MRVPVKTVIASGTITERTDPTDTQEFYQLAFKTLLQILMIELLGLGPCHIHGT